MRVTIERTGGKKEAKAKTVKELLGKLKINPTTVITVVNGEAVTEDAKLNPKDEVLIMSVVSGG